jgi:formylglycine-generating enzyme required for sulfatase activity
MSASASEQHLKTQQGELQRRYDTLTKRIAALDTDIGRELDSERKLVLQERRADLDAERKQIMVGLTQVDQQLSSLEIAQNSSAYEKTEAALPSHEPVPPSPPILPDVQVQSVLSLVISEMTVSEASRSRAFAHLVQLEPDPSGPCHKMIRDGLLEILRSGAHELQKRAEAGNSLAQVGDPRFRPEAWFLPDDDWLGFVEIPLGEFVMGEESLDNQPIKRRKRLRHVCMLPTYYLARYPVTVAQFRAFMKETQYGKDIGLQLNGLSNHPAVGISWHDALAYSKWLTTQLLNWSGTPSNVANVLNRKGRSESWCIMLPSEAEWEKGARGIGDARSFPWGIIPVGPDLANFKVSGLGTTTAVGCFPRGISPYGIEDMSGNVWEWTRNIWGSDLARADYKYPYDALDGREEVLAPDRLLRVLRGGSFHSMEDDIQCIGYCVDAPTARHGHVGFRLAITSQAQK